MGPLSLNGRSLTLNWHGCSLARAHRLCHNLSFGCKSLYLLLRRRLGVDQQGRIPQASFEDGPPTSGPISSLMSSLSYPNVGACPRIGDHG